MSALYQSGQSKPSWVRRHPVWTTLLVLLVLGAIFGDDEESADTTTADAQATEATDNGAGRRARRVGRVDGR